MTIKLILTWLRREINLECAEFIYLIRKKVVRKTGQAVASWLAC